MWGQSLVAKGRVCRAPRARGGHSNLLVCMACGFALPYLPTYWNQVLRVSMGLRDWLYNIVMEVYPWENMEETKQRFMDSLIVSLCGCWLWKRSLAWKDSCRQDSFYHRGKKRRVNIVAYELFNGVILPNNYTGRPTCGTPNCLHPLHTALYKMGSKGQAPPLVLSALQQPTLQS